MILSENHQDLLRAFIDENVKFLVVGAYAMSAHGYPRATGDIDLWVAQSPDNAAAVLRALESFGAPLIDINLDDLQTDDVVYQIGMPPERVDILTSVSGLKFEDAFAHSKKANFGYVQVRVLSIDDLIKNKKATGRLLDLADVEVLEKMKKSDND